MDGVDYIELDQNVVKWRALFVNTCMLLIVCILAHWITYQPHSALSDVQTRSR
jgi:hypothetical protein